VDRVPQEWTLAVHAIGGWNPMYEGRSVGPPRLVVPAGSIELGRTLLPEVVAFIKGECETPPAFETEPT